MNRLANKQILEHLKEQVKASSFLDYKDYLQAIYQFLKQSLKPYSYLKFSEDLGFSKTNVVHLIIRGRRPLTLKAAAKIVAALELSGADKKFFELLVNYQNARDSRKREKLFRDLLSLKSKSIHSTRQRAELEFFSEWYHPAIYEMTQMDDFCSDPHWIADRLQLRIRPEQARKSLQLLTSLGLVRFDEDKGHHVATKSNITTGDEIASVAVIRYHQRLIEMAKESITRVGEDERDISAITVCVSAELARKMKEEVRLFRKRLLAMAEESTSMDAVYQMNLQLFPLTK